jgi:hypothetical protein
VSVLRQTHNVLNVMSVHNLHDLRESGLPYIVMKFMAYLNEFDMFIFNHVITKNCNFSKIKKFAVTIYFVILFDILTYVTPCFHLKEVKNNLAEPTSHTSIDFKYVEVNMQEVEHNNMLRRELCVDCLQNVRTLLLPLRG